MNNYKIYKHINKINNKIYIGITKEKSTRRWKSGFGYPHNTHLSSAIQKYGWDNFEHIVLFDHLTKEEAEEVEIELIAYHNATDRSIGYNIQKGGNLSNIGRKFTEEHKQKISKALLGHKFSQETLDKMSKNRKGKCCGKDHFFFGKRHSKESLKKMSESHKKRFADKTKHPMYGKKHSEETREKMRTCKSKCISVICLETGEIYYSVAEAGRVLGINNTSISLVCNGKQKSTHNLHFKYLQDYNDEKWERNCSKIINQKGE